MILAVGLNGSDLFYGLKFIPLRETSGKYIGSVIEFTADFCE